MKIISREEMIQMAVETRKKVTNAPVEPHELEAYPVYLEKMSIPTSVGASAVYYSYKNSAADLLIINLHGGGFIRARTDSDDLFCRQLVHGLDCKVLDVDYRVAPEYPVPTALNECYDVTKWASSHCQELNIDPEKIVLVGHSAGGNMAAGIAMMANASGDFKLNGVVMDYPPMDLFTDPEDKQSRGKGIPAERARLYNLYYCEKKDQQNYLASPLFAEDSQLHNFPPALMITAGEDSLCLEAEQFALRIAQTGGEITIKRFPGAAHGFTVYRMDNWEKAMELIQRFIKTRMS